MKQQIPTLKSPADFKEKLSLIDLSTQMMIFKHFHDNLITYQRNFVKSFMLTFEEVLNYIPEEQQDHYFAPYKYMEKHNQITEVRRIKMKLNQKFNLFIVDTVNRKLYPMSRNIPFDRYKFSGCPNNELLYMTFNVNYNNYQRNISQSKLGESSKWEESVKFTFNIINNTFVSVKYNTKQTASKINLGEYSSELFKKYQKDMKRLMFLSPDTPFINLFGHYNQY